MRGLLLLFLIGICFSVKYSNAAIGSSAKYRPKTNLKCAGPKCQENDEGLDLTETIKKMGVEKARKLSEVSDLGNILYSGFFTTVKYQLVIKIKCFTGTFQHRMVTKTHFIGLVARWTRRVIHVWAIRRNGPIYTSWCYWPD